MRSPMPCGRASSFRAFEQDARDFAGFAKTRLTMPMLVLTGEKASGEFLITRAAWSMIMSRVSSSRAPAIG